MARSEKFIKMTRGDGGEAGQPPEWGVEGRVRRAKLEAKGDASDGKAFRGYGVMRRCQERVKTRATQPPY